MIRIDIDQIVEIGHHTEVEVSMDKGEDHIMLVTIEWL